MIVGVLISSPTPPLWTSGGPKVPVVARTDDTAAFFDAVGSSAAALATSGSVTMELAALGVPSVVLYQVPDPWLEVNALSL